jgi:hypothetical protein
MCLIQELGVNGNEFGGPTIAVNPLSGSVPIGDTVIVTVP